MSYNRLARYYDLLAGVVSGGTIHQSQLFHLPALAGSHHILVIGGGTGTFLPSLFRINPGCEIWYVDLSSEMIARARKRVENGHVHFIEGTLENLPPGIQFDAVLTFFYLDLFDRAMLMHILKTLVSACRENAIWLAADFTDAANGWQKLMLKIMYRFFKITTSISASTLPDWRNALAENGITVQQEHTWYGGFIISYRGIVQTLIP